MKVKKSFECVGGMAKFFLHFPNGNRVSTIFGAGSYTENYDEEYPTKLEGDNLYRLWQSNDVEIMVSCSKQLHTEIHKKYNKQYEEGSDDSVIGGLEILDWIEIISMVSSEVRNK